MNAKDIAENIAKDNNIPKTQAMGIVNDVFKNIRSGVRKGKKFLLHNSVRLRKCIGKAGRREIR